MEELPLEPWTGDYLQFLPQTEILGVADPTLRAIVDSLYVASQPPATTDHQQLLMLKGAREALTTLVGGKLARPDLVQRINEIVRQELIDKNV